MPLTVLPNGNWALPSDQVTFIHLEAFTAAGGVVPQPAGDVDTAASSGAFAASLAFAVTVFPPTAPAPLAGQPAVSATPLVLESDAGNAGGNIGLVITDSAGLTQQTTKNFDITVDQTPAGIGVDPVNTFGVPQAPPTAPGP